MKLNFADIPVCLLCKNIWSCHNNYDDDYLSFECTKCGLVTGTTLSISNWQIYDIDFNVGDYYFAILLDKGCWFSCISSEELQYIGLKNINFSLPQSKEEVIHIVNRLRNALIFK